MSGVVLLTMAGRSRRFTDVGVRVPKWALRVEGRHLLGWAVDSLVPMFEDGWSLHLVALDGDVRSAAFADALAELPVAATFTAVPTTPPGQAHSALAALGAIEPDVPVAVWNADTHLRPGPEPLHLADGNWLTLAPLEGSHWSFAELDDRGFVVRTAEKVRISDLASVGLYGFEDLGTLARATESAASSGASSAASSGTAPSGDSSVAAETYVAPLYNEVLAAGRDVRGLTVPAARVVPFGTPTEVVASCRQLGLSLPAELAELASTIT